MRVVFLGTGGGVPTKCRSSPSVAIVLDGEFILLDAGEGTQRQILKAELGFSRLSRIFISHLHGDHFFGLFPLLETLSLLKRGKAVDIYSPPGLSQILEGLEEAANLRLAFEVSLTEIERDAKLDFGKYEVTMFGVAHADIPTFGIRIEEASMPGRFDAKRAEDLGIPPRSRGLLVRGIPIETPEGRKVSPEEVVGPPRPGRVVVYSSDTRLAESVVKNSANADLLIHDATFTGDLKERAEITGHSTVEEACEVARLAGVKRLALVHFSARYKGEDLAKIEVEAKRIFPNTFVAKDLMEVHLPPPP